MCLVYPVKKQLLTYDLKAENWPFDCFIHVKIETFIGCSEVFRFIALNKTELLR